MPGYGTYKGPTKPNKGKENAVRFGGAHVCWFCGSDDVAASDVSVEWQPYFAVVCADCDAQGPTVTTREEAIAAWNRPATLPAGIRGFDIEYGERGNILIDESCAPFDGKPVLIKIAPGWLEAYWVPSEPTVDHEGNKDDRGWFWCGLDDDRRVEFDEPTHWTTLPDASPLSNVIQNPAFNCVACEDNPKAPNIPCAVCGAVLPASAGLGGEPVAWISDGDGVGTTRDIDWYASDIKDLPVGTKLYAASPQPQGMATRMKGEPVGYLDSSGTYMKASLKQGLLDRGSDDDVWLAKQFCRPVYEGKWTTEELRDLVARGMWQTALDCTDTNEEDAVISTGEGYTQYYADADKLIRDRIEGKR